MALAGGIGKADSRSVEALEVLLLRGVPGPVDSLSSQWSPEASIVSCKGKGGLLQVAIHR